MTNWFDWSAEDERMTTAFMAHVAALPVAAPAIDPMQLWWKAQLLRRWDAQRRAQAPLDVMQPIEIAAGLACAGLLLYWSVPLLF
jgi:hypothetical protein